MYLFYKFQGKVHTPLMKLFISSTQKIQEDHYKTMMMISSGYTYYFICVLSSFCVAELWVVWIPDENYTHHKSIIEKFNFPSLLLFQGGILYFSLLLYQPNQFIWLFWSNADENATGRLKFDYFTEIFSYFLTKFKEWY